MPTCTTPVSDGRFPISFAGGKFLPILSPIASRPCKPAMRAGLCCAATRIGARAASRSIPRSRSLIYRVIPVPPFDYVVFGGTGDLARRKLLPALYYRLKDGQIPDGSRIIGVSRARDVGRRLPRA